MKAYTSMPLASYSIQVEQAMLQYKGWTKDHKPPEHTKQEVQDLVNDYWEIMTQGHTANKPPSVVAQEIQNDHWDRIFDDHDEMFDVDGLPR